MKKLFFLLTFLSFNFVLGSTWSEPWQEEIFEKSDYFVLGKVLESTSTSLKIELIKKFGHTINDTIEIKDDYYLLNLCSSSGERDFELNLPKMEKDSYSYFFLKRKADGTFSLPTPTSGLAVTDNNTVLATYRISILPIYVLQSDYELTTLAIFNHYHKRKFEESSVLAYILENLKYKPLEMEEANFEIIVKQHISLETIYHLGIEVDYLLINPFLQVNHYQYNVSAARALRGCKSKQVEKILLNKIEDKSTSNYVKVICVFTLHTFKPKRIKKKLIELNTTASEEQVEMGINLFDPRICTGLPTVKQAITHLLKSI